MRKSTIVLGYAFLWCLASRLCGETPVFPGEDWDIVAPQSQGIDAVKLANAIAQLEHSSGKDGVRQLVVVRNGRIVYAGADSEVVHGVWSMTKSFTSTILGLLIDDRKCSLSTKVATFVPELKPRYPDVTFRHLTTMTSGYRAIGDEPRGNYVHGPSRTPLQPAEPLFTPPGSQFAYWDSAMNVYGLALTRIANQSLESFFRERIAEPIGMPPDQWQWGILDKRDEVEVNGGAGNASKHVSISAKQVARFGLLYLQQGNWNGRQLLSAEWVQQATSVQVPESIPWAQPESELDGRGCYGFNWWVNGLTEQGQRKWPGAPPRTFAAWGANDNRLFVIPEWEMVIVRLGLDGQGSVEVWNKFLQQVGDSLVP